MSFKVILDVPQCDTTKVRERLLAQYKLDYTDLLELTLNHWEELHGGDDEILKTALEHYVHRKWPRRKRFEYADLMEALHLIAAALNDFFRVMEPVLSVVLACRHANESNASLELVGWNGGAPIVQVKPRSQ